MPTLLRASDAVGIGASITPSAAEIAFGRLSPTPLWWQGRHRQRLAAATPEWRDRMQDVALAPAVAGQLPSVVGNAGPGGVGTILRGLGSDPAGQLLSPAGVVAVPLGQDWTIWGVSKAGATATAIVAGVTGANGGGLEIRHRTSNLMQCYTRDAAGVVTLRTQITADSTLWHLWMVCWQQSSGTMQHWINGALGTSLGSATGLTLTPHGQRLSALGVWDTTLTLPANSGRAVEVAMLGVQRTYAPADADFRARLRAMVLAVYPSMTIAV